MDLNQINEEKFTDEEMSEVDRLQSDPSSEYYYNDPDIEEGFLDKIKRKLEPYGEDFKGFIEYLLTPSRHFGTGQYNEGGVAEQMDMFGYTAEGAQQEADKFVGEAGNLEEDISKAASFIVPFYDSGVNIANVAQEYMKPEQERDYDYIKSQFTEAGQSAAIEGGLLLMGGVAGKYGAKGIKALADKVKQYEIDSTAMSAFGAGAIRKKPTIKEGVPTIEATGLTDEAIETWRKKNKTSDEFRKALKGRNPELQELAKGVSEGRVFSTTYRKRADELRPIRVVKEVPKPATNKEIVSALNDKQRRNPIIGLNEKVSTGEMVDVRLNIPAYTDYNVWVPTIRHDGKEKYKAAVRLKNVNFIKPTLSGSAKRTDSSKALKVAEGGEKNPFAVMTGEYVEGTDDELFTMSKEVFDSSEWTQVGYDPIKRGFFYDRETGQAILEADEVIQVGHLVLAKNAKKTDPDVFPFNKGGAVMDDQMKMAFMDEGGIIDDDLDVDPVSGNEVPPGSLAEEVRDDIPAQLSEGEYVVPADVVRYYGVKFFEDLRDQAKMGLAEMEANGRIGGEPVPAGGPINDEELSEQEMSAIRQMMTGMAEGGEVQNPYLQQQQLYSQPRPAPIDEKRNTTITGINPVENQMPMQSMADGGQVQGYQSGGAEITTTPAPAINTFDPGQYGLGFSFMGNQPQQQPPVADTPATPETMTLYGPNGEIRTFNMPLSEADAAEVARLKELGYTTTKSATPIPTPTTTGGGGGGSTTQVESDPNSWMEKFDYTDMSNLGSQTSELLNKSPKGSVIGAFMNGTNAAQAAANIIIMEANGADQAEVDRLKSQYQQFLKDSKLEYMPKGLINGDRLAKDVAKSEFVNLSRDAKDPFGNPIFKDDSSFQKHTNEMRSATRSNVAQTARDTVRVGRSKDSTTGSVYKPGGIDVALLKKDDKSKASQAARKKSKKSSAARKSAIDRAQASMKKSGKTSVSDFRKAYEKQGGRFATGGRNKGGLMNKKGKK